MTVQHQYCTYHGEILYALLLISKAISQSLTYVEYFAYTEQDTWFPLHFIKARSKLLTSNGLLTINDRQYVDKWQPLYIHFHKFFHKITCPIVTQQVLFAQVFLLIIIVNQIRPWYACTFLLLWIWQLFNNLDTTAVPVVTVGYFCSIHKLKAERMEYRGQKSRRRQKGPRPGV